MMLARVPVVRCSGTESIPVHSCAVRRIVSREVYFLLQNKRYCRSTVSFHRAYTSHRPLLYLLCDLDFVARILAMVVKADPNFDIAP